MVKFKKFLKAIIAGNLPLVKEYISENININNIEAINRQYINIKDFHHGRLSDGDTALICAVREGNIEVVKLLLAIKGIDVNAVNYKGETALILAASRRSYKNLASRYEYWDNGTQGLSHEELCRLYNKDEFYKYFKNVNDIDKFYEDYKNLDASYKKSTAIFYTLMSVKDREKLNIDFINRNCLSALRCCDEDFTETLLQAGADVSYFEISNKMINSKPFEDTKEEYLSYIATIRSLERNIFLLDNRFLLSQDQSKLNTVFFEFANLFAKEENHKEIAHGLYKVSADLGNETAVRIIEKFRNYSTSERKSGSDNLNQEQLRAARLRFFDKIQISSLRAKRSNPVHADIQQNPGLQRLQKHSSQ
jgi:hypothetical protein